MQNQISQSKKMFMSIILSLALLVFVIAGYSAFTKTSNDQTDKKYEKLSQEIKVLEGKLATQSARIDALKEDNGCTEDDVSIVEYNIAYLEGYKDGKADSGSEDNYDRSYDDPYTSDDDKSIDYCNYGYDDGYDDGFDGVENFVEERLK